VYSDRGEFTLREERGMKCSRATGVELDDSDEGGGDSGGVRGGGHARGGERKEGEAAGSEERRAGGAG
jgi:hypothetical protein